MPRIAYVNGRYRPLAEAAVHIEDRGYQFADGVYEVIPLRGGRLIDERGHLDRLERSMRELRIAPPMSRAALRTILTQLVRKNRLANGILYIQVTRGVAPRDFPFPMAATPALVVTLRPAKVRAGPPSGIAVITVPDQRWPRRDIKAVALLPQVLAKQAAAEAGAQEAWMVDCEGLVTEGASSNAWIVLDDARIVTRPANRSILKGVTRTALMHLAEQGGYRVEERAFSVAEALRATEAFVSSANSWAVPVLKIDGRDVGDGRPGPVATALNAAYAAYAISGAETQLAWEPPRDTAS